MEKNVTLICTTYNCKGEMNASLKTLTSPDNLELLKEIVIVDGGSNDGTWELLNEWAQKIAKLRVYKVAGANISQGRNEAIKRTDADIIVSFDSGTKYAENWLRLMLEPFEDKQVQVVGGLTVCYGKTLFETCFANFGSPEQRGLPQGPSHRGTAYRKKVWEQIGGYPEHIKAGEDTWFNAQWKKLGFKYVHVPQAKQYWRMRKNWIGVFKMARRNIRGHVTLGESCSITVIGLITAVYVFCCICLIWGFYYHLIWYIGAVLYAVYAAKRTLSKGRWRVFGNPVKFLVGLYALTAFDLGTSLGTLEGSILFLRHKITRNKVKSRG